MGYLSRIDQAFEHAPCLTLTPSSKFVFMSDCHRGIGTANDNFLKNELIFLFALRTYYNSGYTYIELGDGDELWENQDFDKIQKTYEAVFSLLNHFKQEKRLYLLYGNHDLAKAEKSFSSDYDYYEGIILKDCITQKNIYLTHGHQADFFNSTLWKLSRFLVRYIWKPFELFGISDPTSAASNYQIKEQNEQRLNHWAIENHSILICGHTHRALTGTRKKPYFNSGCCIYPGSITALELTNRQLQLVKWNLQTKEDGTLYIARNPLLEKICIDEIFLD